MTDKPTESGSDDAVSLSSSFFEFVGNRPSGEVRDSGERFESSDDYGQRGLGGEEDTGSNISGQGQGAEKVSTGSKNSKAKGKGPVSGQGVSSEDSDSEGWKKTHIFSRKDPYESQRCNNVPNSSGESTIAERLSIDLFVPPPAQGQPESTASQTSVLLFDDAESVQERRPRQARGKLRKKPSQRIVVPHRKSSPVSNATRAPKSS